MLGLIITVPFTNTSTTAQVSNIFAILRLCIRHCLRHHYLFKTVTNFDLRTAHINLVQENTEIIDRHKNWNILSFKEALKIKFV